MPVQTASAGPGQPVALKIVGRFDFRMNEEFRRAYEPHPTGTAFVVDLERTEYLDSSALGMLLLLRRHAGDVPEHVRIVNASPDIMKILGIANFQKLCQIG